MHAHDVMNEADTETHAVPAASPLRREVRSREQSGTAAKAHDDQCLKHPLKSDQRMRVMDAQDSIAPESHAEANRVQSSQWKSSVRWFLSEFVVVVAGILIALALQAWWQNRQDFARGAEYQRQILADARATERTLRTSLVLDRAHYSATKSLINALYAADIPTRDEALQWLQSRPGWFADPRPVLGNVNALIETGDIRLVADPKTRAAIIAYASTMETAWADRESQSGRMLRANDLELARFEASGLPPLLTPHSLTGNYERADLQGYVPAYVAAWPRLQTDVQFRTAQRWRLMAYSNILDYNQEMLSATTALRHRLEEATR